MRHFEGDRRIDTVISSVVCTQLRIVTLMTNYERHQWTNQVTYRIACTRNYEGGLTIEMNKHGVCYKGFKGS